MKKKNSNSNIGRTCMLVCVLLFASCVNLTHTASSKSTITEIAQYVCDKLNYDEETLLFYVWGPVSPGDTVMGTKEHIMDVPSSGYVVYIDLHPFANLFHPVQYVFFSESTGDISTFDASSPPLNFEEYQLADTAFARAFMSVENRRAPLPSVIAPSTKSDTRWAVLMNGGYDSGNNHVRYWNDLSNIYVTINSVYGIPDENIIVLCSDGLDPAPDQSNGQNSNPDLDGDGDDDIMYSCVLTNVDAVFAGLAANFTTAEKLFVFTTDHGNTAGGQNTIENLWNHEELSDAHFASLLAAFPQGCEIICTFEPCFSGGFLDNVVVPPGPVVASSSCRYDEYSWAMTNLLYDEYVFYWTAAVKGEDAFGNPVDADANQDGVITMDEAYIYAEAHDQASESPQYGSYPEDFGSRVSLWISNLPPENLSVPIGPSSGVTGREYLFSTRATDPEGTDVYYQFDWGEGNISDWYGPYGSGANGTGKYTWFNAGTYAVRAKAKDSDGVESRWSDPHNITIFNLPTLGIMGISSKKGQLYITIKNTGTVNVSYFNWSVTLSGGFILRGKGCAGTCTEQLLIGNSTLILSDPIFGLGKPTIKVTVETQEQTFYKTWTAKVILFFVFYFQ